MRNYANDEGMQMYGIIKQSASDRLPEGNHEVCHIHFHWTMPLYQFNNHKTQYFERAHILCQGGSI